MPLARILHAGGDDDGALALLERAPGNFAAEGLQARIALQRGPPKPDLADAFAALDSGDAEQALDLLIAALPNADGAGDEIRKVVVGLLGRARRRASARATARRRLAAALY